MRAAAGSAVEPEVEEVEEALPSDVCGLRGVGAMTSISCVILSHLSLRCLIAAEVSTMMAWNLMSVA